MVTSASHQSIYIAWRNEQLSSRESIRRALGRGRGYHLPLALMSSGGVILTGRTSRLSKGVKYTCALFAAVNMVAFAALKISPPTMTPLDRIVKLMAKRECEVEELEDSSEVRITLPKLTLGGKNLTIYFESDDGELYPRVKRAKGDSLRDHLLNCGGEKWQVSPPDSSGGYSVLRRVGSEDQEATAYLIDALAKGAVAK